MIEVLAAMTFTVLSLIFVLAIIILMMPVMIPVYIAIAAYWLHDYFKPTNTKYGDI